MIRLKRDDRCRDCGCEVPAGTHAEWSGATRTVRCAACVTPPESVSPPAPRAEAEIDRGVPGASARAEHERRRTNREQRTRDKWGRLGGLAVALSDQPAHERAWALGANGEERVAKFLERKCSEHGVVLLHDRGIPRSKGNIDHLAIGPAGVVVIDAKRYSGRVEVRRSGGLIRARQEELFVRGRNRTSLVDGARSQVRVVEAALASAISYEVPVRAILCFVEAELPMLGSLRMAEVEICYPRRAAKLCSAQGPLTADQIKQVSAALASALPAAA